MGVESIVVFIKHMGAFEDVWLGVGADGWIGGATRERGGGRACLREIRMGGCLSQGLSCEVEGFPMVVVLWNKGVPAGERVCGVGHP